MPELWERKVLKNNNRKCLNIIHLKKDPIHLTF